MLEPFSKNAAGKEKVFENFVKKRGFFRFTANLYIVRESTLLYIVYIVRKSAGAICER